jgi:hypothetical protein
MKQILQFHKERELEKKQSKKRFGLNQITENIQDPI